MLLTLFIESNAVTTTMYSLNQNLQSGLRLSPMMMYHFMLMMMFQLDPNHRVGHFYH